MTDDLRRLRVSQGLSLSKMAAKTGLDRGLLSRLENRRVRNPWPRTLFRAAKGYGVSVEDIEAFLAGRAST